MNGLANEWPYRMNGLTNEWPYRMNGLTNEWPYRMNGLTEWMALQNEWPFIKYYPCDQMKYNEMGGTCGTYGAEETCIQGSGGKTWGTVVARGRPTADTTKLQGIAVTIRQYQVGLQVYCNLNRYSIHTLTEKGLYLNIKVKFAIKQFIWNNWK